MTAEDTAASAAAPPRGTRPRNRRALIIAAATDLFHRFGYEQVGMSDVADAVNVRPSALYRHFAGKPQLLTAAVVTEMQPLRQALVDASSDELDEIVRRLAAVAVDHRRLGVLWQQEARGLPPEEYALLRAEIVTTIRMFTELVRARRTELDAEDARMLSLCACSALCSMSRRGDELSRAQQEQVQRAIIRQILTVTPAQHRPETGDRPAGFTPVSRRERLLGAAITLFAERGYAAVSMEDIGAQVGIAGPSVYHHFESKQRLLAAALARGDEWLRLDMYRALRAATDPADALRRLITSYVDFTAEHSKNVDILVAEVRHLADDQRAGIEQRQREYVGEWLHLMHGSDPEIGDAEARIRVRALLAIANDVARTPRLRIQPGTLDTVKRLGIALLLPRQVSPR